MKPNILIFDLDGTLTPSKSALEPDMAKVLEQLLRSGEIVVVTSGGMFKQFQKQFLPRLNIDKNLFKNIYLLPTSGAVMFIWDEDRQDWEKQYAKLFNDEEKKKIIAAVEKVVSESDLDFPETTYGERIEDRDTQISMSALGQDAPLEKKKVWDPNQAKRKKMIPELERLLPEFEVRIGGTTTIDITHKGIDKEFGVNEFFKFTNLEKKDAIFYGDALFKGGNDYAVIKTGIPTVQVSGPEELIPLLREYLS